MVYMCCFLRCWRCSMGCGRLSWPYASCRVLARSLGVRKHQMGLMLLGEFLQSFLFTMFPMRCVWLTDWLIGKEYNDYNVHGYTTKGSQHPLMWRTSTKTPGFWRSTSHHLIWQTVVMRWMARHRFIRHCTVLENLGFVICSSLPLQQQNFRRFWVYVPSPEFLYSFQRVVFFCPCCLFSFAALQVLRTRLANIQRRILRPCGPFQTTLGNDWNDSFLHLFSNKKWPYNWTTQTCWWAIGSLPLDMSSV